MVSRRPTIKIGQLNKKAAVRKVQRRLRKHGYQVLNSEGRYNNNTRNQVIAFQHHKKLQPDGIVGKLTWAELLKKPKRPQKPAKPFEPTPTPKPPQTPSKPPQKPSQPPQRPSERPNKPGKIIDVSNHQPNINWKEVKKDETLGAYLKLSEGEDWKDPSTNEVRLTEIKGAGLNFGFYHFLRPKKRDAAKEAHFFIKEAKKLGGWGDYYPVADIEVTELDKTETGEYLARFLEIVRTEGKATKILIYASPGWWRTNVELTKKLKKELKHTTAWIAHWHVQNPEELNGIKGYDLHQYTDVGRVLGIEGNVDLNRTPNENNIRRR